MRVYAAIKTLCLGVAALCLVASLSVTIGSALAASVGGSGGGSTGWPSIRVGPVSWANSYENALIIGNGTNYWAIYHDATTGLQFVCVIGGVANACDYVRTLAAGKYQEVRDSSSNSILKLDSSAVTLGKQAITSGLGVEFTESDTNPTCASGNYTIYADTSEAKLKKCENGSASDLVPTTTATSGGVVKASNETVNNSSTFQDDDELTLAVSANSTYAIEYFINYEATTTGDMKFQFTAPAGASGRRVATQIGTSVSTCNTTGQGFYGAGITTSFSVGGIGAGVSCDALISVYLSVAGTAGNIVLQWAQDSAEVSDAIVRAGSHLTWRKLS